MSVRSTRHPFSDALYERQPDGNVRISAGGQQGLFRPDGRWISGALREADPQLCVWVSAQVEATPESDSHITTVQKAHPLA
jgi:hypothetical protein